MVEATFDFLRSLPLFLYLILQSYNDRKAARLFTRTRIVMSGAANQLSIVLYNAVQWIVISGQECIG